MTKRQLEELLHHGEFLRWLSRRLLRDAARAEDVVQDTWLAVLHSNKSPSEVHRGWLAGVLRNLARRKLREERRRARREQVVARPHLCPPEPSPLDAEELRVRLAKRVLRLPEHYRESLLLRYYDGLEPSEIAARTGVPASTVRTRIQRGLDRIRRDLGGSAYSVAPLLRVIAAGKATRRLSLVPLAAAAILLVAALAALQGNREVSRAPHAATRFASRAESPLREDRSNRSPGSPELRDAVLRTVVARPSPILTGSVELPQGALEETVQLELTAPGRTEVIRATARNTFAANLSPLFEPGRPASILLTATHPECEPFTRELSADVREVRIALRFRPLLEPELLVPVLPEPELPEKFVEAGDTKRGGAVSTATLQLDATVHLPDDLAREPIALAVCREGRCLRFRLSPGRRTRVDVSDLLTGAPVDRLVVLAASRHTVVARRVLPIWSGPRLEPLVLRLERGRIVRGRVVWENGAAGAGATVALVAAKKPLVATTADAEGRFEFALPRHSGLSVLAVAGGARPATARASDGVRLVLREGLAITGLVKGPSARTRVHLVAKGFSGGFETTQGTIGWTASGPRWTALSAPIDDRGAFRFAGLVAGAYTVRYAGEEREVAAPGHVEFAPRRVSLSVFTTDEDGPVPHARVTIGDATNETDTRGRATFTVLEGADLQLRAEAAGFRTARLETKARAEVVVKLTRVERLGAFEVSIAADNVPLLAVARVTLQPVDRIAVPVTRKAPMKNGVVRIDELFPGAYKLAVEPGGWHFPEHTMATIVAGETTQVVLSPAAGGRISAASNDALDNRGAADLRLEPAPSVDAVAQQTRDDETSPVVPPKAEPITSDALVAPGRYLVWVVPNATDGPPRVSTVVVVAGERSDISSDR